MSKIFLIIVVFSILFGIGCTDENTKNCEDFLNDESKHGYCFANGSYVNVEFATFGFHKNNENEISLSLFNVDKYCADKEYIAFRNIPFKLNDTIFLKYSYYGLSIDFPTAIFRIRDYDTIIETYDLFEDKDSLNWILIDSKNSDTSEISGKFQLSFITTFEPYLTGEKERWDDPNRPDTLHFTNGKFKAVLSSY